MVCHTKKQQGPTKKKFRPKGERLHKTGCHGEGGGVVVLRNNTTNLSNTFPQKCPQCVDKPLGEKYTAGK